MASIAPSLLNVIIDTNPRAWALSSLSLSKALASLTVFLKAHLTLHYPSNHVAVLASHVDRAQFLCRSDAREADFRGLLGSLNKLILSTSASALTLPPSTALAGAITLALTYTNKLSQGNSSLTARILVLSSTPASPDQYIPLMNAIFAAQRLRIPIDVLVLSPGFTTAAGGRAGADSEASPLLQQAAITTGGIYLALENAHGLLQALMQAFLPSPPASGFLVQPARPGVDFRSACFCHRRVIDIGYVCSVCLSIFCEVPEDATCLTCGTHLKLGRYGRSPAVVARRKKRRRKEETGTPGGATPSGDTPAR